MFAECAFKPRNKTPTGGLGADKQMTITYVWMFAFANSDGSLSPSDASINSLSSAEGA